MPITVISPPSRPASPPTPAGRPAFSAVAKEWTALTAPPPRREAFALLLQEGRILNDPAAWVTKAKSGPATGKYTCILAEVQDKEDVAGRKALTAQLEASTGLKLHDLAWIGQHDNCFIFIAILPAIARPFDRSPLLEPWRFLSLEQLRLQPSAQPLLWALDDIRPPDNSVHFQGGSEAANYKFKPRETDNEDD